MHVSPYLIVGAGLAGIAAARQLPHADVCLVEKSRGPGGRMASKRLEHGRADIGAQFFTVRDPVFETVIQSAQEARVVAPWAPRMGTIRDGQLAASPDDQLRYVGIPYMNALTQYLASGLEVTAQRRAVSIERHASHYRVHCEDGDTLEAKQVLVTCPVDQMHALLSEFSVDMIQTRFAMDPTLTIVVESTQQTLTTAGGPIDACFGGRDPVVDFVCFDGSKPGRDNAYWVVHSTPEWLAPRLENDVTATGYELLAYVEAQCGLKGQCVHAHRWRYARPVDPKITAQKGVYQVDDGVWIAGDYLAGGRVEGAYLSGVEAAHRLLGQATADT
jgi:predicted NAD/FAD-dependent oxidoreductase